MPLYDVRLKRPVTRYRTATVEAIEADSHEAAFEKAQLRKLEWTVDDDLEDGELDVEIEEHGGSTYNFMGTCRW